MERLTNYDRDGNVYSCEEERLLNVNKIIGKEDMYKIMMHLTEKLAEYENMHEKIIKRIEEIKATSYYPHNFTGQMVEDLEWVLSQIN